MNEQALALVVANIGFKEENCQQSRAKKPCRGPNLHIGDELGEKTSLSHARMHESDFQVVFKRGIDTIDKIRFAKG